jgi:hypothetical protein
MSTPGIASMSLATSGKRIDRVAAPFLAQNQQVHGWVSVFARARIASGTTARLYKAIPKVLVLFRLGEKLVEGLAG